MVISCCERYYFCSINSLASFLLQSALRQTRDVYIEREHQLVVAAGIDTQLVSKNSCVSDCTSPNLFLFDWLSLKVLSWFLIVWSHPFDYQTVFYNRKSVHQTDPIDYYLCDQDLLFKLLDVRCPILAHLITNSSESEWSVLSTLTCSGLGQYPVPTLMSTCTITFQNLDIDPYLTTNSWET